MLLALLTGCGGGSGSSRTPDPEPETDPGPAIQNILVYQDGIMDKHSHMRLHLLNRDGETRQLSEDAAGTTVAYHVVSPDGKRVAYWYGHNFSELVLVLLGLDSPPNAGTRLVIAGGFPAVGRGEWLL